MGPFALTLQVVDEKSAGDPNAHALKIIGLFTHTHAKVDAHTQHSIRIR